MVVDRGGLRYPIEVVDKFSAPMRTFQEEVRQSRLEMTRFRRTVRRLGTDSNSIRATARTTLQLARATRRLAQAQGTVAATAATQARAQTSAERQTLQLQREKLRTVQQLLVTLRAQKALQRECLRLDAQAAKLADQKAAAQARAAAAQTQAANRQSAAARRGIRNQRRLRNELLRTEGAANRISFTFRRLFGILAAFAAARAAGGAFLGLISSAVDFNRQIEDSRVGLAALFTTAGQVRNALGELVDGPEAFAEATKIADEQLEILRLNSLRTVATFQELQRAFQAGVGPGLEAGLNLDQIQTVTVRISQAAAALGLQQNQLIEEVRSLLRGTIQARTTLIASVLGITNEDIRLAKEQGNLFDFLQERLDGFGQAAKATQQTFTGLLLSLKGIIGFVGGEAATGFFDELKLALNDIRLTLVDIEQDADGVISSITPRPEALEALGTLFDGLANAGRTIREGLLDIDPTQLRNAIFGLARSFEALAAVAVGAVQGIVEGFGQASVFVNNFLEAIGGVDLETVKELSGLIVQIGTALIGANIAIGLLKLGFNLLLGPVRLVVGALSGLVGLLGSVVAAVIAIPIPLLVVFSLLAAAAIAAKDMVDEFAGFDVKLSTAVRLLREGLFNVLVLVAAKVRQLFLGTFVGTIREAVLNVTSFITGELSEFLFAIAAVADAIPGLDGDALARVALQLGGIAASARKASDEVDKLQADLQEAVDSAAEQVISDFDLGILEDADAATIADTVASLVDQIKTALSGILDEDLIDLAAITEAIKKAIEKGLGTVEPRSTEDVIKPGRIEESLQKTIDNITSGLTIIRGLVSQTSNFISNSLIDALDPTQESVDLKERFARFLQDIARLILQQLVQLAVAKAVLGLGGVVSGGAPFAEGGLIPGKAMPSFQHYANPQGLARGGIPRPKGLPRTDTVPIWASPGEFMMKVDAVKKYGLGFMEAVNRGLIDASDLGGLTQVSRLGSVVRAHHGYAAGGEIERAVDMDLGLVRPQDPSPATAGTGITRSVVVGSESEMEKLLAGGAPAIIQLVKDNADEIGINQAR